MSVRLLLLITATVAVALILGINAPLTGFVTLGLGLFWSIVCIQKPTQLANVGFGVWGGVTLLAGIYGVWWTANDSLAGHSLFSPLNSGLFAMIVVGTYLSFWLLLSYGLQKL